MDISWIIEELEAERARLSEAIEALRGSRPGRGRPKGSTNGRRRHLSAAGRRKISEAMKRRWAERKNKGA